MGIPGPDDLVTILLMGIMIVFIMRLKHVLPLISLPPPPSENASLVLSQKNLQVKSRGFEEIAVLEDAEKPVNNVEDKSLSVDEEKLAAGTYCWLCA